MFVVFTRIRTMRTLGNFWMEKLLVHFWRFLHFSHICNTHTPLAYNTRHSKLQGKATAVAWHQIHLQLDNICLKLDICTNRTFFSFQHLLLGKQFKAWVQAHLTPKAATLKINNTFPLWLEGRLCTTLQALLNPEWKFGTLHMCFANILSLLLATFGCTCIWKFAHF